MAISGKRNIPVCNATMTVICDGIGYPAPTDSNGQYELPVVGRAGDLMTFTLTATSVAGDYAGSSAPMTVTITDNHGAASATATDNELLFDSGANLALAGLPDSAPLYAAVPILQITRYGGNLAGRGAQVHPRIPNDGHPGIILPAFHEYSCA